MNKLEERDHVNELSTDVKHTLVGAADEVVGRTSRGWLEKKIIGEGIKITDMC